jgi:FAD/FMN-containing dehydrogenase
MASIGKLKALQGALQDTLDAEAFKFAGGVLHLSPSSTEAMSETMRVARASGLAHGKDFVIERDRFDAVEAIDVTSCLAHAGAHVTLAQLESRLASAGLTLGRLTPHEASLRLGSWLEGPYAGLRAVPGGRLEPAALSVEAGLWTGHLYRSHPSPRSAAGPDLDALLLGAGGQVGLVSRAVVRALPRATTRERRAFAVASPGQAVALLQGLLRVEALPAFAALAGPADARVLMVEFFSLAYRVKRDGKRATLLGASLGLASRDATPPDAVAQGAEAEVGWDGLEAALGQAGGGPVELYRIARESVVLRSPKPLSGPKCIRLDGAGGLPAALAGLRGDA